MTDVVVEPVDGPMGTAFTVSAYPTFALIGADGTVTASSYALDKLPVPALSRS
ncbi:hypothetical protein [Actinomadura logoneensis]|uniref:hypothetical protein n=1 Tax=Actinomadura logoneensis TaxID=2293572 RepID=UPI001314A9C4|nr:hypothetical protein [Actinomadura logoneensis]